jgi:hypothetical protein
MSICTHSKLVQLLIIIEIRKTKPVQYSIQRQEILWHGATVWRPGAVAQVLRHTSALQQRDHRQTRRLDRSCREAERRLGGETHVQASSRETTEKVQIFFEMNHPGTERKSRFFLKWTTQGRQRLHILKKLKSFKGPVLKCGGSSSAFYLNELVIHEIRNNAPAIFQNFLFICCKI